FDAAVVVAKERHGRLLDEIGQDQAAYDLVLPAVFAVPLALVLLHLRCRSALHADCSAHAIEHRRLKQVLGRLEAFGLAQLEEPHGLLGKRYRGHSLLLATCIRTIRVLDREAELDRPASEKLLAVRLPSV